MEAYKMWTCFILLSISGYVISMGITENDNNYVTDVTVQRYRRQDTTTTAATTVVDTGTPTAGTTVVTAATSPPFVPNIGTPGFACSVDLYHRVNTRCCILPDLIERDVIAKCNKASNSGAFHMQLAQQSNGKNIPLRKFFVKNSGRSGPAKNASIVTPISQICLAQCVFKQLRWTNQNNQIDENYLFQFLSIQLPQGWVEKLNTARQECAGLYAPGPDLQSSVSNNFGRKCLIWPSKLLRCLKRHFLTNCLNQINTDKQCSVDLITLRSCDINLL